MSEEFVQGKKVAYAKNSSIRIHTNHHLSTPFLVLFPGRFSVFVQKRTILKVLFIVFLPVHLL